MTMRFTIWSPYHAHLPFAKLQRRGGLQWSSWFQVAFGPSVMHKSCLPGTRNLIHWDKQYFCPKWDKSVYSPTFWTYLCIINESNCWWIHVNSKFFFTFLPNSTVGCCTGSFRAFKHACYPHQWTSTHGFQPSARRRPNHLHNSKNIPPPRKVDGILYPLRSFWGFRMPLFCETYNVYTQRRHRWSPAAYEALQLLGHLSSRWYLMFDVWCRHLLTRRLLFVLPSFP